MRLGVLRYCFRPLPVLFVLLSSGTALCAQSIRIKLIDGRNGRPMATGCVDVWVGTEQKGTTCIPTDANGVAQLRLTDNIGEIDIQNRSDHVGSIVEINPVFKYEDSLRIHIGYALCIARGSNFSWLAVSNFSTKQLLQQGYVSPNTCGKATASPTAGEVVVFVRPLTWWEKLKS